MLDLEKEIFDLGPIERDRDGVVSFDYYSKIYCILTRNAKKDFFNAMDSLNTRRRKAYKLKNDVLYNKIVEEQLDVEERKYSEVLDLILAESNLTGLDFHKA